MSQDYTEIDFTKIQELHSKDKWVPTPKQTLALQVPYAVFELLYGGALAGGKSEYLLAVPIVCQTLDRRKQLYEHPLFQGIIFRRTFPQLEKSLIPRAKYWYKSILGAEYNENKKLFTFPSGARLFLSVMEREDDVLKFDTDEYNYIGIDQAEQFSEFQLRMISSRVRSSTPELPRIIRYSANPGGVSHRYLRDRFVKPDPKGNTIIYDKETNSKRIFIPARLEDNQHIDVVDPEYKNRLNLLPEAERKAKKEGDWFSFVGQVFTEFRKVHIPGEPSNAVHVVNSFPIPEWWPRILAIDWGYRAKTFALWGALSPDSRLFIYREYSAHKTNISTWASEIAKRCQYEVLRRIKLDPSAWQKRGDDLTIEEQFRKWSGMRPTKADNDRIGGKQLIHDLLRFEPKAKRYIPMDGFNIDKANQILRINGLIAYKNYMEAFTPEEEEKNLPRLQIFSECTEIIEAIESCQYDDKDKDNKGRIEDVMEWVGDDPYDTLRYLVKEVDQFVTELKLEGELHKLHNDIMQQFEDTKDYNTLEFRMRHYEKLKEELQVQPVHMH